MIQKFEGIIVSVIDFQEYDVILKVFSPDHGIASLILKGGQSKKLRQGNPLSPLTQAEFHYIEGRGDLLKCREITPIACFLGLRDNFDRLDAALKMLQPIAKTQMEGKPALELYQLLISYLKKLEKSDQAKQLLLSFYLKLLRSEGRFAPTHTCTHCKTGIEELALYLGESFCKTHAPGNAILFSLEDVKALMTLAYSRSFDEIFAVDAVPDLEVKIKELFHTSI